MATIGLLLTVVSFAMAVIIAPIVLALGAWSTFFMIPLIVGLLMMMRDVGAI